MITNEQLQLDIEFLARRQAKAGSFSHDFLRDTGMSSNSIVSIAYCVLALEDQIFPADASDMTACENMWKKLPAHRKTGSAFIAMSRARNSNYYGK